MRTRKHKSHIAHLLTLSLIGMMLAQSLYANSHYGSDSVLELSRTGGYAKLADGDVNDLDYSKDFSVEVITKIEPHSIGGRWGSFIQKASGMALYNPEYPGFAIGTNQGHFECFGQKIVVKVGDGTNHVDLGSSYLEGYVYAVMTWDSATKKLILYINGDEYGNNTNPAINPLNIENNYDLQIGKGLNNLNRDIFMIRIWNRELSDDEVTTLYDNYDDTGQHTRPSGFSATSLVSEWLMYAESDGNGDAGTTHIKDNIGTNHLELLSGADISFGTGALALSTPAISATGIDKAVTLVASGGTDTIGGGVVNPLHYYFQIDTVDTFDSANLKESGWIIHYGKYIPLLKPSTLYYWRVKVKDSDDTPNESAYTAARSFTTEGSTNWYVRPGVYSGVSNATPIPIPGTYGIEDGTSYANAWNGIREIDWGENGVEVGDNLYVCGSHNYDANMAPSDFATFQAREYIRASGFSEEYPITIRMDYPGDTGTLPGTPNGFRFYTGRSKYIKFYKANFDGVIVTPDRIGVTTTDTPVSTHIVFDSCTFIRYGVYWLYAGHDYWTFRNNDFSYGKCGIYSLSEDTILAAEVVWDDGWGASYLLIENNTFTHIGVPGFFHKDAHAVGIQGGRGHIIQGNYIEDTGEAIAFHTENYQMKDMTVRYNFIKNINVQVGGTGGNGINVSGLNTDSLGERTGFKIYNNIIMNVGIGATEDYEGRGISSNNKDSVEIYNNVIINPSGDGISFAVANAPAQGAIYNNIIVNPGGRPGDRYIQITGTPGDWSNFSSDYNLYYPATDLGDRADFYYGYATGCDNNSILADPMFVSPDPQEPADFKLRAGSPAIDAGVDVGLTQDFEGNPVPQGLAFDIGAYEAVIDPDNPPPVLQASGDKSVNENVTLTFTINATDSEPVTYLAQSLPSGATLDSQTGDFAWTPSYSQAGSYQVRFIASDGNSHDSETITITVNNVNRAPILGAISDQSVDENSILSFSVDATDPDGQAITYSVSGLPSGAVFVSQTLTWTPSFDQAGAFAVTFTADDGQDQDSQAITITVNNMNRTPVLAAINNQSVWSDDPLTFTVNATDPDGDTVTYSASTIPSGAAFADQDFDWTPSQDQGGSYAVTFTASDGQLQNSQPITITVNVDSLAPTVTNSSPAADSIQAPLNNLINLNITDAGKGVDADSVTINVNNNIVYSGNTDKHSSIYGECYRVGTKANYRFIYQPNEMFDYDQTVSITANATDLAGNAMNEQPYSFVTEMRSFGENQNVDSRDIKKGRPVTVCDNSGNIWAAWHAGVTGSRDIYIGKLSVDGEYFGDIINLTEESTADQCNPVIAIGSDDKLYVAWQDDREGDWDIYVSTSNDGTTWSTETMVNEPEDDQVNPAPNQVNPVIVIDGENLAYVVWQDDRGSNQDIFVATSSDGFVTTTVLQITSDISDQIKPAIAADSGNTIYVVWTDTRNNGKKDIYGAASNNGPWTNVAVVTEDDGQSSPAIATEAVGSILHLVWVDDRLGDDDIFYDKTIGGLSPLTGSSIIDDSTGAYQISPVIITTGYTENDLMVFACWRDERNPDADLYFAEIRTGNETNVFVGDEGTHSDQSEPAVGIDGDGYPYLVWTNERTNICYAGSTYMESAALASTNVSISSTATVGTTWNAVSSIDDVSAEVPQGAYLCDIQITISKIKNPPKSSLELAHFTGTYEFGPSGMEFIEPVTITIPYEVNGENVSYTAYWYNPLTNTLSQQGITDVETIVISSTLHALRFKTTHFSAFILGGAVGGALLGGGGGGGGCSVSAGSEGNIVEFFLPYIAFVVVLAIRTVRDARYRKARSMASGKC